jgi:FMN reductase
MPALLTVIGTATPPGRLHRAVGEASARARADVLDLGALELGWAGTDAGPGAEQAVAAIERADGVLLATPVYRGSLTAILKNLLDLTPVSALDGKPVALVAMGASDHHFLGAERHLRDILAFFGALTLPTAVYLSSKDFDEHGAPRERAVADLDALLAALTALAGANLRDALGPRPFAAAFA